MPKKLNTKDIFAWCSELSLNSGEGKLALQFIKDLKKNFNNKITVRTPYGIIHNFNDKKILNNNHYIYLKKSRYFYTFVGLIYCWIYFFKKKKCCYINYLPLWNSLLFILLPPNTILGPITGGANFNKQSKLNFIVRKYFFLVFYKISLLFIFFRTKKIIFSTNLLKKYLSKYESKHIYFNYCLKLLKDSKIKKKDIDLLLYNRNHSNKFINHLKLTKYLLVQKKTIHAIGENITLSGITNHGYISNEQVKILLERTKFIINSSENFFTIFLIEALSNKVRIICNSVDKEIINKYNNKIFINLGSNKQRDLNFNYKINIKEFKTLYIELMSDSVSNEELKNYFKLF
jgi:hypothetical protein